MRNSLWIVLAGALGCDSLWSSSLIPNPQRCDVTPDVCPQGHVCDAATGRCLATTAAAPSARCSPPWRTAQSPAGFAGSAFVVSMSTVEDVVSIALGDLDGSGTLDLAAAGNQGTLWSFLGTGTGQFNAHNTNNLGGPASLLRLADLNSDGRGDFLVSNIGLRQVHTFLAASDGGFGMASVRAVANLGGAFAVADLNRSGGLDVAAALDGTNGWSVLLGDGSGGLAAGQGVPNSRALSSLVSGDFNGDGTVDLATIATGESSVYVYYNRDNSSQTYMRQEYPLATGQYAYGITSGDFDCDGRLDLAIGTTGNNRIALLFGNGQGGFPALASLSTAAEPRELVAGDIDGDGATDIVFFDQYGDLYVVSSRGTRSLSVPPQRISGASATASLQIADVNKDGKADLAMVEQYKSLRVLLNTTP